MYSFLKLFKKDKEETEEFKGGIENFMTLIRVYYQSVMAVNLGITNINFLPDVAVFKRSLKIATLNGRLGLAEKNRSRKMLINLYGVSEEFFTEIDASVKKNCKTQNDIKNFLFLFQGFSNDLMMLMGNLMKWKFRIPNWFKKVLRELTAKTIHDILTKETWKDDAVRKTVSDIRKYQKTLGYTEPWMTEYVYNIVALAKKEKKVKE
ncbi:MAG: hypothetical protein RR319_05865 [Bacteroides sp.]